MKIRYSLLAAVCLLFLLPTAHAQLPVAGDGGPGPAKSQHLTVQLLSASQTIAPGGTVQAGLAFTLDPHWHVYWLNAGDAGEPPKITWTLPSGITAGALQFPIPQRLPNDFLMDFGYENAVTFPILFTTTKSLKPGTIHLDAKVSWLVCARVCIPGKAHLGLNLTVVPGAASVQPTGQLAEAIQLLPQPPPAGTKLTVMGGKSDFVLTLITGHRETTAEFYPFDQAQIVNAAPQTVEPLPNGVRLRVQRDPGLTKLPANLHGLIKLSSTKAYDLTAAVTPGEVAPSSGTKPESSASGITTITAIGLAFLGGIILNLMPCVFPVLFLKGLALVQSSGEERSRLRSHGLVYTLGILVSFWIIVAVLLALRAGGAQAGWGFQLQSPVFLAILASGIFFFALSLAGQFDIGLSFTSAGGELAQKQGLTGTFFTGVLATIVATPCTAPLMGAAIGFALAQPAGITFAVFTALGLGLATPYLLLSFQPAWIRILPRPGAWMEIFKQLTAVVFFATVIWLAYVYGSLFVTGTSGGQGVYRIALLLSCFLLIAVAGWILGKWPARWTSTIAAILVAAIGLSIPLYQPKDTTLVWQPYSQQALDQARAAGHPVFIDFTAAWCLSCQVNERLVLRSADVQRQLADHKLTLLKADWTQYDPEITKELASLNRSGVPTYVIYPSSQSAPADVLPELLTKDLVLEAIKRDAH